ncbi:daunorubicin resistance ABC transporter ATP-binding subunit [Agromyces flavus]|uniref:ABC-2 type transport system ATP-binding protein n=1 Tax=Agromyces flavus TaxID=589382 RepID=A0A1H1TZE4_9MICO|nr:ATP-binding cassette domain-containing protein [Agromyces flavus]MCP2368318.1 daunorubicin resistance ABC transporter ATP-binding subunit [Agromyces flavus]GGI47779.1 daunorubicin resistance protein DrrA family ABC transporter ATP-binding protein [Agromyces flavus]SDS65665.1 ABC-2 type transport system ATP-binding protein [Agromyces flavus]
MTLAIDARGIAKRFGATEVLRDLDLAVDAGSVFGLLGPNGAGKTTTINILTTLVRPDAGTATVAGVDLGADPDGVRARISLTGQSAAVDEVLTGRENLVMLARLSGLASRAAAARSDELLERFELAAAAGRRVATYSGGMRRRLDLALSLVVPSAVIFLDEPTTGLDARSRQELWHIIREIADGGATVFLTTQYLEEADRLADRIAVLDGGRIAAEGTASELKAQVGGEVVELRGPDDELIAELPTDGTVHGLRAAVDELDRLAASATGGTHVSIRRPSLDDVFLAITSHAADQVDEGDLVGAAVRR